jgi:hypothetical protein
MTKVLPSIFLKGAGIVFLFLFLAARDTTQQIIENSELPQSASANLKEILRVSDQRDKFFFEEPYQVFTGKDGSIYVQEPKKFLKFDADGNFVKNLMKWGEGPGELNGNLTDVIVRENDIILYSSNVIKLVRINLAGELIEEKKFKKGPFGALLGYYDGKYYLTKLERQEYTMKTGIQEENRRILIVSEKEDIHPTPYLLPLTVSEAAGSGMRLTLQISRFMPLRVSERYVFLFHTPEYLIKVLDLEKGEITHSFRRNYKRVKYDYKPQIKSLIELAPMPKYHNDLCRLLWYKNKLWAVTSTFEKNKGIVVDVFSPEGKYLDNFYLPLFKINRDNIQYYAPMAIHGNFLYTLEPDENDLMTLVKYEITNK